MVGKINALEVKVVSIDIPSGVSADHSEPIGEAVMADVTVTLGALKPALVMPPVDSWAGDLVLADIGIPSFVIDEVSGDRV